MSNIEKIMAGIIIAIVYSCLLAVAVKFLWNSSLVPAISGINSINYLEALGIICLCIILFKTPKVSSKNDEQSNRDI